MNSLKLQDEKTLAFSRMIVVDGNNSAKRFMSAALQDDRDFKSDYFLTREEVDIFKNEVKSRPELPRDDVEDDGEDEVSLSFNFLRLITDHDPIAGSYAYKWAEFV